MQNMFGAHKACSFTLLRSCWWVLLLYSKSTWHNVTGIMWLCPDFKNGHLSVCQLIISNVKNKNPPGAFNWTPLHWAARYGHFKVCQLFMENIEDKNPIVSKKVHRNRLTPYNNNTPLHLARSFGHHQLVDYIEAELLKYKK